MRTYICLILLAIFIGSPAYARRGCCSHHGGVAGCDPNNGRQICNDGSYSPSCMCGVGASSSNKYMNQSVRDFEARRLELGNRQKLAAPNNADRVKKNQDPNVVCGTDANGAVVCELLR